MAYTDFTLETIRTALGVASRSGLLFPPLVDVIPPPWLSDQLARGRAIAVVTEKARGEFIVAPVLLALRELTQNQISILSGHRLDVDRSRELIGECDFLLMRSEPLPIVQAPILAVVEAKRGDIEGALGQCGAQMIAARVFNAREGTEVPRLFGCVTNGGEWRFMRLDGEGLTIDPNSFYINHVGSILAAFLAAVTP